MKLETLKAVFLFLQGFRKQYGKAVEFDRIYITYLFYRCFVGFYAKIPKNGMKNNRLLVLHSFFTKERRIVGFRLYFAHEEENMRYIKRIGVVFMTLLIAFGLHAVTVSAKEIIQDGIKVELTTDKDTYQKEESVKVEVKVTNENETAVQKVTIQASIPTGYELERDHKEELKLDVLNSKEDAVLSTTYQPIKVEDTTTIEDIPTKPDVTDTTGDKHITTTNTVSANTGDTTNHMLWFTLAGVSGLGLLLLLIRKKKLKKASMLLLCLLMMVTLFPSTKINAQENGNIKEIKIEQMINVNGKEVPINAVVSYETQEETPDPVIAYTRGEWIQKLVDVYGYPENTSQRDATFADIADSKYKDAIETAITYGILDGSAENFDPEGTATREFAAYTAIYMLGYYPSIEIECGDVHDIIYKKEVYLAVDTGLMNLVNGNFYPNQPLTQVDAAQILQGVEEVCNSINDSDSPDGFVFREGTVVLDEQTSYTFDDKKITIKKSDVSEDIKPGTIIVAGYDNAFKVEHIEAQGDDLVLEYTTPELSEFLSSMNVSGDAHMDFSQFVPAEGVTVSNNSAVNGIQTFGLMDDAFDVSETNIGLGAKISLSGDVNVGDGWKIGYSLDASIPSVGYKFDIDFNGWKPTVKNAYIKVQQTTDLSVSFGKGSDPNNPDNYIKDDALYKYIPLGSVPVVGTYGVGIVVEIDLVMTAEGKFEVQYNLSGTYGCQVINNHPRNISALQNSFSAGVAGAITIGPKLELAAELFNQNLISFSAEAGGKASGYVKARSTGLVCADITLSLYAKLNAFENTLIDDWLDISISWDIWDENNSPLKVSGHYENMQEVEACTYENGGTIEGVVSDADDRTNVISNAKIEIYNSENMELESTVYTDAQGKYTATVPGGTHLILISKDGYIPFESLETVMDKNKIYIETYLMVNGDESEIGTTGGKITDSVTGAGISNVTLTFRKGWNKRTGEVIKKVYTNNAGAYQTNLPLGNYTVLMEKGGYVTNHFNTVVTKQSHIDKNGTMVPGGSSGIPSGDLRIVLTWGDEPRDLDAHLTGPTVDESDQFHVYFGDKVYKDGRTKVAFLDVDDTNQYGPETVTIYQMNDSGTYSYYIHDYSYSNLLSCDKLAKSGAKVQVFAGEQLIATYHVPSGGGTLWHVFDFDASTRTLKGINQMSYHSDAYTVGERTFTRSVEVPEPVEQVQTSDVTAFVKQEETQPVIDEQEIENVVIDTVDEPVAEPETEQPSVLDDDIIE